MRVGNTVDDVKNEKAAGLAARALQEIEQIGGDSKLSALSELLLDLGGSKMRQKRICVCTQFVGTLYYLNAEIEGLDMTCQLLYGGMQVSDRFRSLALFSEGERILLATAAATDGVDRLREVTDLVLYDVPTNRVAQQQLLGRFEQLGRRSQLNVYAFAPSNCPNNLVAASVALLNDLIVEQARLAPRVIEI